MSQDLIAINGMEASIETFLPPVVHTYLESIDAHDFKEPELIRAIQRWTRTREIGRPRYTSEVQALRYGRKKLALHITIPVGFPAQKMATEDLARYLSGISPYFVWAGERVDNLSAYSTEVLATSFTLQISLADIRKEGLPRLEQVLKTLQAFISSVDNYK